MRDTIHSGTTVRLLSQACTAAAVYSNYVDLKGYEGCRIILTAEMDTASAGNQYLAALYESDVDASAPETAASYSAVAAADYIEGVSPFAALVDTTTYCQEMGYIGAQRYIMVKLTETGTAIGEIHITAVLERAENSPVTAAPTTGAVS